MGNANFFKSLSPEDNFQIKVANHIRAYYPKLWWLHIPNEARRSAWERYRMSLMGIKKGAPDIMIIRHRLNYDLIEPNYSQDYEFSGLALELKWAKNKQSKEQKENQIQLESEGWIYKVFTDNEEYKAVEQACKFIDQYMQT